MSEHVIDELRSEIEDLKDLTNKHAEVFRMLLTHVEELRHLVNNDFERNSQRFLVLCDALIVLANETRKISDSDRAAYNAELQQLHAQLDQAQAQGGDTSADRIIDRVAKIQTILSSAVDLVAKIFGA